jgi:YesN/AraC family two-component response regulator
MLIYSTLNVSQIGEKLDYFDNSYFVSFFNKNIGLTPYAFLIKFKSLNQNDSQDLNRVFEF